MQPAAGLAPSFFYPEDLESQQDDDEAETLTRADAFVLTFEAFNALLKAIEHDADPDFHPIKAQAKALATFCFRFGLRPCEVYGLRAIDITESYIFVRPYEGYSLKTPNGNRKIPWPTFMSDATERAQLFAFTQRCAHLDPHRRILHDQDGRISRAFLDSHLNRIIKRVTGHSAPRPYHLRHSFATWLHLALKSVDLSALVDEFTHLKLSRAFVARGHELTQALFGSVASGLGNASYAVARLMGHGGPGTTAIHYQHGFDLLIKGVTDREFKKIDMPGLGHLLGREQSALYELLY